jgi:hypothetical protein
MECWNGAIVKHMLTPALMGDPFEEARRADWGAIMV